MTSLRRLAAARVALALVCAGVVSTVAAAQALPGSSAPAEQAKPADPFGRETPRGMISGLLSALAAQDYTRASSYLDLSDVPVSARETRGPELAADLQATLDKAGALTPFSRLSSEPAGRIDDGLPIGEEQVGVIRGTVGETPLIAKRETTATGETLWRLVPPAKPPVSKAAADAGLSLEAKVTAALPEKIRLYRIAGAPIIDWIILVALGLACGAGAFLVLALVTRGLRAAVKRPKTNRLFQFAHAAFPPLSLYLAVVLFFAISQTLQVAIVARQGLSRLAIVAAWVAVVWFLWRLIDTLADVWGSRMARRDRRRAQSIIVFVRRGAKALLAAVAFIAVLDVLGVNVTTGVAALGLGGLALALGAQKTVENLVGSVTVLADAPFRVGDFCRIGDVTGTIDDVGMRSTRIRTNERTVVTIPNGELASRSIENFSRRDRFLFNPTVGLTYDVSPDKMAGVLGELRAVLAGADDVLDDGARVRFIGLGASSLDVEIFAYIKAVDYAGSLEVRERLLMQILRVLEACEAELAFPTQTLRLAAPAS